MNDPPSSNPPGPSASSAYPAPSQYAIYAGPDGGGPVTAATVALSQQHRPTPNATGVNRRKRQATGAPSSRGVANLTPEQLAKKRANDREAQRAIRERTRNTIEGLERRIRELESQQPFQDLQRVIHERDTARAECEHLQRRLARVAGIASGNPTSPAFQGQPNLHELANVTAQQTPLPPLNASPTQHSRHAPSVSGQTYEQSHIHPALRSPQAHSQSNSTDQSIGSGPNCSPSTVGLTTLRRWSPSLERSANTQYSTTNELVYDQVRQPLTDIQNSSNGERLGVDFIIDAEKTSPISPSRLPYILPPTAEQPIWARLPRDCLPTCPLDSILTEFIANSRAQLAAGVPKSEVIGPDYPSFSDLKAPHDRQGSPGHPVSILLTDILSKFPNINKLPEQVAVRWIMFVGLRWMLCPCESCYSRLPEWLRPLTEQLEYPHAQWTNSLPCTSSTPATTIRFQEFFVPFTSTLSLNWPYPDDQVLQTLPTPDHNGLESVRLNPVYESHLYDLKNWSLGTDFQRKYPELVDAQVRIVDHPRS